MTMFFDGEQFQSTPAHYICQNSRVSQFMIRELLKHKANFNIKNNVSRLLSRFSSLPLD
jgi:hypothetical protein